MSFLRGSTNYVWCTTSVLGKGATGAVFQGVNKNNGEPVAVKTFNQLSHMRPHDVQMREFEVLKKVKHENIVKLLAIEEEQEGRGKVIVMELCTGGSLFNILDDPENTYGLQEEEFLLVLEHLTAGMKHLRDNRLVHRDLKPGNIMKFICDDGSTIYKLTDFGAARELEEDQQFMSLYGTEEYLHPDMYERAVLRKPVGKTFGATVDLWSIGVTLYHVATGNLPFRPYGGRRNKETMYYITTKKASGVIAGTQTSENGEIDWCTDLPNNCQLSLGLKKLVTPILAGLLEVDSKKIWSFELFFSQVTKTLNRKLVHLFYMNRLQSIRIYLHPDDTYDELQTLIKEQTEVSPNKQILLYKNTHFTNVLETDSTGKNLPVISPEEPLLLFSEENNNVTLPSDIDIPKFPSFPNVVSVENDATLAKQACSTGHVCKRRIEKLSKSSRLTHYSVQVFITVLNQQLSSIANKIHHLKQITTAVQHLVDHISRSYNSIYSLMEDKSNSVHDFKDEIDSLRTNQLNSLSLNIEQLYQRCVTDKTLSKEWTEATRQIICPSNGKIPARAKTLTERLRDSWQHLLRDRATRTLSYNDEQFHVLERIKIGETGKRIKSLLDDDTSPHVIHLSDCLADWYKMAQTIYLQSNFLNKDMQTFARNLEDFQAKVIEEDVKFHENLINISKIKFTSNHVNSNVSNKINNCLRIKSQDLKYIRTSIKDLSLIKNEFNQFLESNSHLMNDIKILGEPGPEIQTLENDQE
uniref:Serine/threonine-protein kinase TBK1 n=1 Tax=Cacopsylla melanoneura TaxID=428564 RepID=A0A8D9AJW9_9HEMI